MLFLRGYQVTSIFSERLPRGWQVAVKYVCDTNRDDRHTPENGKVVVTGRLRIVVTLRALFSARRDARARLQ